MCYVHVPYKQKGDRVECGNSRGIFLFYVAGKVLAKVMLTRLSEYVVYLILPESQCGSRRGCSKDYMAFAAWQQQEKCREQHQDLYMAFEAFDIVNRDILWNILRKIWLPSHFYCHTTSIPYRYLCSSCYGCFSVLQLFFWRGNKAMLYSSPNHLWPVSGRYDSCISPWPPIIW